VFSRAAAANIRAVCCSFSGHLTDRNVDTGLYIAETEARPAKWDSRLHRTVVGWKRHGVGKFVFKMFPDFEAKTLAERNGLDEE
jgi:hypothetical protein